MLRNLFWGWWYNGCDFKFAQWDEGYVLIRNRKIKYVNSKLRPHKHEDWDMGTVRDGIKYGILVPVGLNYRLFKALEHGESGHRERLKQAINAFFKDEELPNVI